ncbi:polysaccharide pyruvyl transferase family protein [bacterium]|nr:polysaccharide pyruvyl transferase family protein [bacterium]
MQRRTFIQSLLAALAATSLRAAEQRPPRILLRSSWQVVNIGDIAHTPGVLALLEKYVPNAEVTLWSSGDLTEEVAAMEHQRFPKLTIVKGSIKADGKASNPELQAAIDGTDFLLHGSGASFVAVKDVMAFVEHTGKPFGVYGITYSGGVDAKQRELMTQAKFLYFRDTVSLGVAKSDGIACPIMEFGPDGAFGCDLRNDAAAESFLAAHHLQPGEFVCCIPRLRYTPYWLIKKGRAFDEAKHARNEEMREHDHAVLRGAITAVVRETGKKVLLCPEDMTHMAVAKENLYDKLPSDVLPSVVWRDSYWLTDEALSTYIRSAGLFGLEMHSPIMCIGNGVPAIVGRFAEQTSKGLMWRDIGLGDWLFDLDQPADCERYAPTVVAMIRNRDESLKKVAAAQRFVQERQAATMQEVARCAVVR